MKHSSFGTLMAWTLEGSRDEADEASGARLGWTMVPDVVVVDRRKGLKRGSQSNTMEMLKGLPTPRRIFLNE
jgi:hypothetical protein